MLDTQHAAVSEQEISEMTARITTECSATLAESTQSYLWLPIYKKTNYRYEKYFGNTRSVQNFLLGAIFLFLTNECLRFDGSGRLLKNPYRIQVLPLELLEVTTAIRTELPFLNVH